MSNVMSKTIDVINSKKFGRSLSFAMAIGSGLMLIAGDASAQSAKSAAVSVFNVIYGLVGVIAGIALLVQIINWKVGNFLGSQDPKKLIVQTLLATCLAFGVVGVIQALKSWASGSADIGSL